MGALDLRRVTASSALDFDGRALDHHLELRQFAVGAQNESLDELIEDLAEVGGLVASVDDGALRRNVELALRSKLDSEELGRVGRVNVKSLGNVNLQGQQWTKAKKHGQTNGVSERSLSANPGRARKKEHMIEGSDVCCLCDRAYHVGNDGLDTVTTTLDLGGQHGHLSGAIRPARTEGKRSDRTSIYHSHHRPHSSHRHRLLLLLSFLI